MLKVLCIDDDPHIHQLLNPAFQKKGYLYSSGLTGSEGLYLIDKNSYDIVIVDLKLPDIQGVDLCRNIRINPENAGLILVLVSAHIRDVDKFKQFTSELNLDLILQKPFDPGKLIETLSLFLIEETPQSGEDEIDDSLLELRMEYLGDFPNKLEIMKDSLHTLKDSQGNMEAAKQLLHQTHKIHGNAGIFGLHELGNIASDWEDYIDHYIETSQTIMGQDSGLEFLKKSEKFYGSLEERYHGYAKGKESVIEALPLNQLGGNAANIADSTIDMAMRQINRRDNKLILMVEDDPAVQRMTSYALKTRGYSYEIIEDGDEARKRILDPGDRGLPGLLVLDVNIPGTDGFTLLREFQDAGVLNNMNALMLTSHGREDDMIKAFNAGAVDYVTKPFSIPVLMFRIQRALTRCPNAGA